jgi:8-oxo-dGTP pyrophosphatase MutT (NUDIX family)
VSICDPAPECLAAELSERLRSPARQIRGPDSFVSQLSYGRHRGPASSSSRAAAVAILLYPYNGGWRVPFTLRPRTLAAHGGQVSLPGGAVDPGETDQRCALRELHEELGVPVEQVRPLGCLSPIYVYRSDFRVQPFVLMASEAPRFQPNPAEVEQLLEIPVAHLCDRRSYSTLWVVRQSLRFEAPCIRFREHRIWGATAKIVADFLVRTRDLFAPADR